MKFITDFHIHSHYSIATSKNLIPEYLEYWARLKGINVIGTGDCIHPGWLKELSEKLEPAENGLFRLKQDCILDESRALKGGNVPDDVFFMLTGEISSIYKKNDKVRKVHNVCVFPDFESVTAMQRGLEKAGNIRSDGRPILGLDARIILEMTLETHDQSYLIPAHIWTPWFSVLGSKSGFNTLEECYEDLTQYIFAVETGLSSDPPMNRVCSFLDRFKLVSNSDAHSPEKLGREANLFDTDLSYEGILAALKGDSGFTGTIEFYPQEGKYHYDGHRKCDVCWDPVETARHHDRCPVCGKGVTKGVMYRVAELADRDSPGEYSGNQEFYSITQLPDLISEILQKKSTKTRAVTDLYKRLIERIGSEFHILLNAEKRQIEEEAGELVAEGIERLRQGHVHITNGYDGEFGRIRVFTDEELGSSTGGLFASGGMSSTPSVDLPGHGSVEFDLNLFREILSKDRAAVLDEAVQAPDEHDSGIGPVSGHGGFNSEQATAIRYGKGPCMIIAGPGSGKTRVLTERIAYLIEEQGVLPENILAMTFTNKAVEEIRSRLSRYADIKNCTIATFHAFGLSIIKDYFEKAGLEIDFNIADEDIKLDILDDLVQHKRSAGILMNRIEKIKQGISEDITGGLFDAYNNELRRINVIDLSDCIYLPVKILTENQDICARYRERFQWLLLDEFQDINRRQYELVSLIAPHDGSNIFIIGDPDQSIYGFRGADPNIMETAQHDYRDISIIELTQSYRCPENFLLGAGQVVNKSGQIQGTVEKVQIHIEEAETERSEADWIASRIEMLMGGVRSFSMNSGISDGDAVEDSVSLSDFAVLCRASFMFGPVIEAFQNHGIPFQVTDTVPYYKKEPLASIIKRVKWLFAYSHDGKKLSNEEEKIMQQFHERVPVSSILSIILRDYNDEDGSVSRFIELAEGYGNRYEEFFRALSLREGVDDYDRRAEAVSLMTMHASKGLEFSTVFIPGCEQGIIPFELFGVKDGAELNEEERLLYVAMTRSKSRLFCSYARKRLYRGQALKQQKSIFLDRIEKRLLETGKREKNKKENLQEPQLELF